MIQEEYPKKGEGEGGVLTLAYNIKNKIYDTWIKLATFIQNNSGEGVNDCNSL